MPDRPSIDSILVERGVLRQGRRFVEDDRDRQVGIHADGVVLVGRPVEAGHAGHLAAAGAADHDVVAAFADELVEAAIAEEHVVPVDAVMGEDFVEVVAGGAVEGAGFDPVVALVAEDAFGVLVAVDEVVAVPAKTSEPMSVPRKMKSWPSPPMHQVEARAGMDDVVAVAGLDVVVAAGVA